MQMPLLLARRALKLSDQFAKVFLGHPHFGQLIPDGFTLRYFSMRRADVRELLQDVGVGLEAGERTLVFCQESDAVIDDVVSEKPAVGILCGLRRIET